jgi:hypothetical protein
MNRLVISILILSFFSLSSVNALADTEDKGFQQRIGEQEGGQVKNTGHKQTADVNNVVDPNKTQIDEEDATEKALLQLGQESKNEVRQWLNRKAENRITLAKAVQKQVNAELNYLRKIAVDEGAEKTVQAVDQLLAARNKRFEKIINKLQAEKKSDRKKTREESRSKRQSSTSRRSRQKKQ